MLDPWVQVDRIVVTAKDKIHEPVPPRERGHFVAISALSRMPADHKFRAIFESVAIQIIWKIMASGV
ncbi:MAG: hypothetical protein ACR2OZ_06195 [Verrucomicrobiales bacterium]